MKLSAKVSSQFVSSLLIGAPYAVNPVEIELIAGEVVSEPYIEMTVKMMKG